MGTGTAAAGVADGSSATAEERQRFSDMSLVVAIGWAAYAINDALAIGQWPNSAVELAEAAAIMLVRSWFRSHGGRRQLFVAAHLVAAATLIGIVTNCMLLNQNTALGAWFLAMLPLFAAYLIGVRPAVLWACITAAAALLLWLSEYVVRINPAIAAPAPTIFFARVALI